MAKLPNDVKELFEKVGTVALATSDKNGQPNACVVGMKSLIDDETVYLSDQFFKKTLANLQENPQVAIVFWEGHDAFQIHGTAEYVNSGAAFEEQKAKVDAQFAQMGMPVKAKGGIFVHVDSVYITASGPKAGEQIV